jgi:hypothetical protein
MKYESIEKLNSIAFKRRCGVRKKTFQSMVKAIKSFRNINKRSNKGAKPALDIEEQVLVTLEYWREYRTYFHIATRR